MKIPSHLLHNRQKVAPSTLHATLHPAEQPASSAPVTNALALPSVHLLNISRTEKPTDVGVEYVAEATGQQLYRRTQIARGRIKGLRLTQR